jgi:hypothetical protein
MSSRPQLFTLPESHPFSPLTRQYSVMRDLCIEANAAMERIAPTPSTLAEPHPLDFLTGEDRDGYILLNERSNTFSHACYMLYNSINTTADEFGGL